MGSRVRFSCYCYPSREWERSADHHYFWRDYNPAKRRVVTALFGSQIIQLRLVPVDASSMVIYAAIMAGNEDITGPHKICVEVRQRSMPQSGHITARVSPGHIEEVLKDGDGFLVTRLNPYEELMVRVTP